MKKLKTLAVSLAVFLLVNLLTGLLPVSAETIGISDKTNENLGSNLSKFSFALNDKQATQTETSESEYVDYYTTYGQAKANDTMMEELYITLDKTLTFALRDDSRKSYSFSQAWSASKDAGNYFEKVFKQTNENGDSVNYYNQVYQFYRTNKNAEGFAKVTEEIVPALKAIAAKLPSLQSEDLWPALCYYKRTETEGKANPYENDPLLGQVKLVYGDVNLADEDAFVLFIMGDGFDSSERDKLYEKAEEFALYLMGTSPFSEFTDAVKIYAMSVDSNESGVSRDCEIYAEADNYMKDTYFGTSFWCGGMQRLVSVSASGLMRLNSIMRYALPNADFAGLLVNSDRYGGSGGTYCTCSLNESAKEIFIHEIAHTIADLADEYYAGDSYFGTHPNMSNSKKVENLPWADFYGLEGVGKYAYVDDLTEEIITYGGMNWYKPCDKTCKMEILWDLHEDGSSTPIPFCPVCSEALRKNLARYSNVTEIFYQPYNVVFKDDGLGYKLSAPTEGFEYNILDYVLLRKGDKETTLSALSSLVTFEIKDQSGKTVTKPTDVGNYTVSLSFAGNSDYAAKQIEFSFEIVSFKKEKGFIGCVEDILATNDYNVKYTLINEAISLYETVNREDSSVVSAKATLDEIIQQFNEDVDSMNADSKAAMSVTLNLLMTFAKIGIIGLLGAAIKLVRGGRV